LDGADLEVLGWERFRHIPELLAADFLTHGGRESSPCAQCGDTPATDVVQVDFNLRCLCLGCRQALEIQRHGDKVATNQPVLWEKVLWRWFVIALAGALAWSIVWPVILLNRLPVAWSFLPLAWGLAASWWIYRTGTGFHWVLVLGTVLAASGGILAADLWVFHRDLLEFFPDFSWFQTVQVYCDALTARARPLDVLHGTVSGLGACAWLVANRPKTSVRVR
jgi:hypothetical protein